MPSAGCLFCRNIPTRVGKTHRRVCPSARYPEHPHARGENWIKAKIQPSRRGTSPRAWGKRFFLRQWRQQCRNIPTRVGKTLCSSGRQCERTEHPHARGENRNVLDKSKRKLGTSPRAWGKHFDYCGVTDTNRNIPTRVGKTPGRPGTGR